MNEKEILFRCPGCKNTITISINMDNINGYMDVQCETCGKMFRVEYDLQVRVDDSYHKESYDGQELYTEGMDQGDEEDKKVVKDYFPMDEMPF